MDSRPLKLSFLLIVLVQGCAPGEATDRSSRESQEMHENSSTSTPWLVVSDDPTKVRQALETSRKNEQRRLDHVFSSLSVNSFVDSETTSLIEQNRKDSIDRLHGIASNHEMTDDFVGASILLCRLHDSKGITSLLEILRNGSVEQRLRVLNSLDSGVYGEDAVAAYRHFLFADETTGSALLRQLDDSDPKVVKSAIQCCGFLGVPGVREKFVALLRKGDVPDCDRVLFWLSKGELTNQVFDAATHWFDSNRTDSQWGVSHFEAFVRGTTGALKSQSQERLRAYLTDNPDSGETGFSGNRLSVLTTLSETAELPDLSWLKELATTERGLYAVDPLSAWVRLEPGSGREIVIKWLNDPEHCRTAIDAAARAYAGTQDAEITAELTGLLASAEGGKLSAICSALDSVKGGAANTAIQSVQERLDPAEAAHFRRSSDPSELAEILNAVRDANLLNAAELAEASKKLGSSNEEDSSRPSLFAVMAAANSAIAFDAETGMLPCRHDELIESFAAASRGKFQPEGTIEIWQRKDEDDFEAPYSLQFVSAGRLYQAEVRNFDDWYDVERVVETINTALNDTGCEERFIALAAEGQIALFIFSHPTQFPPVAQRFHVALGKDPGEAMEKGIEFEERVRGLYDK